MKWIAVRTIAGIALVGALGVGQPSAASVPCADCVVQGVVEMAGWQPNPYSFQFGGTIVGSMIDPTDPTAVYAVGTITGSIAIQNATPTGQAVAYRGTWWITVTMGSPLVMVGATRSISFYVQMTGNAANWQFAGAKATQPGGNYQVAGDFQLVDPIGGLTYVGTLAGSTVG